jgi:hypothetical protein
VRLRAREQADEQRDAGHHHRHAWGPVALSRQK